MSSCCSLSPHCLLISFSAFTLCRCWPSTACSSSASRPWRTARTGSRSRRRRRPSQSHSKYSWTGAGWVLFFADLADSNVLISPVSYLLPLDFVSFLGKGLEGWWRHRNYFCVKVRKKLSSLFWDGRHIAKDPFSRCLPSPKKPNILSLRSVLNVARFLCTVAHSLDPPLWIILWSVGLLIIIFYWLYFIEWLFKIGQEKTSESDKQLPKLPAETTTKSSKYRKL